MARAAGWSSWRNRRSAAAAVRVFLDAEGGKQAQFIGYAEVPDDAVYIQDQNQVAKYTGSAELLRSVALPQPQSVQAIKTRLAALD